MFSGWAKKDQLKYYVLKLCTVSIVLDFGSLPKDHPTHVHLFVSNVKKRFILVWNLRKEIVGIP